MVTDATRADALAFIALLVVAVAAFGVAVWFGLRVIAPRIGRALDRAESEEAQNLDRHD